MSNKDLEFQWPIYNDEGYDLEQATIVYGSLAHKALILGLLVDKSKNIKNLCEPDADPNPSAYLFGELFIGYATDPTSDLTRLSNFINLLYTVYTEDGSDFYDLNQKSVKIIEASEDFLSQIRKEDFLRKFLKNNYLLSEMSHIWFNDYKFDGITLEINKEILDFGFVYKGLLDIHSGTKIMEEIVSGEYSKQLHLQYFE